MPLKLASIMSTFPTHVEGDTLVSEALQRLESAGFNHLPVSEGDRVVGVVSRRMLRAARAAGGGSITLGALCDEPFVSVEIGTPLADVVERMRELSADAAVVLARGRLAGIVTNSDICRVLIDLMPGPPPHANRPDVA
ncbi:MAG: CBS domain-containing protein [Myxococcota bacterium]